MYSPRSVLEEMVRLLGAEHVVTDQRALRSTVDNTMGVEREVVAVVRPSTTAEVQGVVDLANRFQLALHPVSRGRNIGYGEKAPIFEHQVIVELERMNRIRSFDPVHGKVVVEPGVTQEQLYDFLKERNAAFWMDVTGSTSDSSILGNTVEGGFGHSPVGDRRRLMAGAEVVLGDGTVFEAGSFPGLGPDLNGLFVQSNFGIVTAVEVTLFPVPERYLSFMISVPNDGGLEPMIETIGQLRRSGTLTSLVHVANATRSLMSAFGLPKGFEDRPISCAEAAKQMSTPVIKAGYWTAIGGLYGTRRQVAAARSDVKRAFRAFSRIDFASDRMIDVLEAVLASPLLAWSSIAETTRRGVGALRYIHGLSRGTPSNVGEQGVSWRIDRREDVGFFWWSPTFPATGADARAAVEIAEALFGEYDIELPITMSFVNAHRLVGTMSCTYNKRDPEARERAETLYHRLRDEFSRAGIGQYRSSVPGMSAIRYDNRGKRDALARIKQALDPNNVIAPGRYGIGCPKDA